MMLSRFSQLALKRSLPVRTANSASFSKLGHGKYKTSTGLVGLPVDPNACANIVLHYQALLDRMAASDMPETAQYRIVVEKIANYRIKAARENPDDPDLVEELCRCGQVEELVEQAKDEMIVLEMYLKERVWELISDQEPVIEYNPDPAADNAAYEEMEENEKTK